MNKIILLIFSFIFLFSENLKDEKPYEFPVLFMKDNGKSFIDKDKLTIKKQNNTINSLRKKLLEQEKKYKNYDVMIDDSLQNKIKNQSALRLYLSPKTMLRKEFLVNSIGFGGVLNDWTSLEFFVADGKVDNNITSTYVGMEYGIKLFTSRYLNIAIMTDINAGEIKQEDEVKTLISYGTGAELEILPFKWLSMVFATKYEWKDKDNLEYGVSIRLYNPM